VKQAIILAGGKGTRLSDRLKGLPKPLVDVAGKPLLEHQIQLLKKYGYTDILLLVNYGANYIEDFCSQNNNWGINVRCLNEGHPLGTAGATLAALSYLEENFLVVYGDTMLEVDLMRFENFHNAHQDGAATLFLHPNDHPYDSDLVGVDDADRIYDFYPYPHNEEVAYPNLVNAALYYVRRSSLESWSSNSKLLDFGKDLFPAMIKKNLILYGYNSPEYIKDCGTPERLDRVCADLISGRVARASLDHKQSAIFLDRDGTINVEQGHLSCHEQFRLLPNAARAIVKINQSEYRSIVVTNQPVIARGDCSVDELKYIHNKMETLLGKKGAYLDRIYYCPHHPDSGFNGEVTKLKIDCSCRKPNTGMIERAKEDLNIDVNKSWLIGDSTVDVMTAERSGLRSILVETGFSGADGRHLVTPDFTFPELMSAVDFIVDDYPHMLNICNELSRDILGAKFIFIGGLSRSGKSTLSSCLKYFIRRSNKSAIVVSIDRWLKNNGDRTPGVRGRYAIDEINSQLEILGNRKGSVTLDLPIYDKIRRSRHDKKQTINVGADEIVIVEGTLALSLMNPVSQESRRAWFIEVDEKKRHERVLREYLLRGMSVDQAEKIYVTRQGDETPAILATKKYANNLITL
jgi:histidinol-phosphate phosphatase family protein